YCHRQISLMPAEARALYRQRVDPQAEAWFRAGVKERDRDLLGRVVDQAFLSSWGDDALNALAELAFEAGQFEEALMLWKRIDTNPATDGAEPAADARADTPGGLIYVDTNLDRALIEAKKVLCHVFLGQKESVPREIAEFRRRYPDARGTLGAVEG